MSNTIYKLTIDEEGVLVFPDELVDQVGWKEGDELFFRELADGNFSISTIPFSQEDLLKNHGKNDFGQHQADASAPDPELHPVAGTTVDRG